MSRCTNGKTDYLQIVGSLEISFVYLILNVGKAFQSNSYHALQIHERFFFGTNE